MTIDPEVFTGMPEVVAVVSGASKARAVEAALEGHLVHGLVVDTALADVLLAD